MRRIRGEDAPSVYFLRSDEAMMRYIDRPVARQVEDVLPLLDKIESSLNDGTGITWGIALASQPETLIGTIGFWRLLPQDYRAEIGYALHRDYWGGGLMSEALAAVLHYGFTQMSLHSVEANINSLNTASARLLERAGFVKEAHFRENFFWNGVFMDTVIYSKLVTDQVSG